MPTNVFYPSLNDFCRKYLVEGPQPLSQEDILQLPGRDALLRSALFEHLLLFDTLTIKVYGENIPLLLLLRLIGERGLDELLDQGAIRFVLWTPIITHSVTEMPGIHALQSGHVSSLVHRDPEQSLDSGMRWLGKDPPRALIKRLKRKVLPRYEAPADDLANRTIALTNSAFAPGKLKSLGFDPEKQRLDNLPLAQRAELGKCATGLLEYEYLLSRQMTAMSSFEYFSLFSDSLKHIETAGKTVEGYGQLSRLENMPDLPALFPTLQNGLAQIPGVRAKRQSEKFKKWLSSATTGDKSVTEEYLAAISNAKGPLDTRTGKFFKSVALASVGAAAGHAAEGSIPAALAGGAIAQTAGPAVDFALDLLDEFLLEGLRKGWHPRMFFNDLRKLEKIDSNDPSAK